MGKGRGVLLDPGEQMRRFFVNSRCLGAPTTGIQRYLSSLLPYLPEQVFPRISPPISSPGVRGHWWEQWVLPRLTAGSSLWSPGNTGPIICRRHVVTIHDASALDHPEWFDLRFSGWYRILLPLLMKTARGILTDSHFSKTRLEAHVLGRPPLFKVVHLGVDPRFCPQNAMTVFHVKRKYRILGDYFLFVGSLEPRKNLRNLLRAWKSIGVSEIRLVLGGSLGRVFRDPELGELPSSCQILGKIDDSDLPALYSGAIGFVFPSFYEGFGFPPLEAMACGCPVIVSRAASLPEVCGEAAWYVDPHDPMSIARGITAFTEAAFPRGEWVARGLARAGKFSWADCAAETRSFLEAHLS